MAYTLKLYITGSSTSSQEAMKNLKAVLKEGMGKDYNIRVIDVLKEPQLAEDDKIRATPTLVREEPAPIRKILGDCSDKEKVLMALELIPRHPQSKKE